MPAFRRRQLTLSLATLAFLLLCSVPALASTQFSDGVARRRLGGPGSSPPSCRSKCGGCAPCTAVHVPIHPGVRMTLEYYPEAWRCKCGDKYFMP